MVRLQNIKNLNTEKVGIQLLRSKIHSFIVPTIKEKQFLYEILKIDYRKYSRSIDGVILNVESINKVKSKDDFTLVEIKTTNSKSVKELPYGVFFGMLILGIFFSFIEKIFIFENNLNLEKTISFFMLIPLFFLER